MYNCMEHILKGDAKPEFISHSTAQGNRIIEHYAIVMANMTKHVFPAFAYRDQKHYLSRYLRKLQPNEYLPFSPPETEGQASSKSILQVLHIME